MFIGHECECQIYEVCETVKGERRMTALGSVIDAEVTLSYLALPYLEMKGKVGLGRQGAKVGENSKSNVRSPKA
jgi:hypothetical protein